MLQGKQLITVLNRLKMATIKPLPLEFQKHGYDYKQIERSEHVAIYSQSYEGEFVAYEVFRIKKEKERNIMGKIYPPAEVVPSTEKWGIYGFTCSTLEKAQLRKAELEKSKFGLQKEK